MKYLDVIEQFESAVNQDVADARAAFMKDATDRLTYAIKHRTPVVLKAELAAEILLPLLNTLKFAANKESCLKILSDVIAQRRKQYLESALSGTNSSSLVWNTIGIVRASHMGELLSSDFGLTLPSLLESIKESSEE